MGLIGDFGEARGGEEAAVVGEGQAGGEEEFGQGAAAGAASGGC